jgi:hypothetical protein
MIISIIFLINKFPNPSPYNFIIDICFCLSFSNIFDIKKKKKKDNAKSDIAYKSSTFENWYSEAL